MTLKTNHTVMRFNQLFSLLIAGTTLLVSSDCYSQCTGFSYELDTMFLSMDEGDQLAELAYHGVYNVYAEFTSPTDMISAVYSDVAALGSPPMGIDAGCGCYNAGATSMVLDETIDPSSFSDVPGLQYTSFWTIGMTDAESEGELPSAIGLGGPEDLCSGYTVTEGAMFVFSNPPASNAIAGEDLKVLIARVTTCGDFSIQACVQTFAQGNPDSVYQWCSNEPLFVPLEGCADSGACNYNPNVEMDDGSCDYSCLGCTDPAALNYNPSATADDGSCIFFATNCDFVGDPAWADFAPGLYLGQSQVEHELGVYVNGEFVLHVPGAYQDGDGGSFNVLSWDNLTWSGLPEGVELGAEPTDAEAGNQSCLTYSGTPFQQGVFEVTVTGDLMVSVFGNLVSAGQVTSSFTMVITPNANGILGCTYVNASNYLPVATIDNGSCVYAGCMDPEASNFQIFATSDDGSCSYECTAVEGPCMFDANNDGSIGSADLLDFLTAFGVSCE